jgi:hypothetical protein
MLPGIDDEAKPISSNRTESDSCGDFPYAHHTESVLPDTNPDRANARVAPRLWLHGALCCVVALTVLDHTGALIASLVAYAIFYH